jgi:hypothetical protein
VRRHALAIALLSTSACASAPPPPSPTIPVPPTTSRAEATALQRQVVTTAEAKSLHTVAAALVRDGEIVWSAGFARTGQPVPTRATRFSVGEIMTLESMVAAPAPWVERQSDVLGKFHTYVIESDATAAAISVPDRKLAVVVLMGGRHAAEAECLATALLVTSLGRPELAQCTK